jgi:hypothetical protein
VLRLLTASRWSEDKFDYAGAFTASLVSVTAGLRVDPVVKGIPLLVDETSHEPIENGLVVCTENSDSHVLVMESAEERM